LFKGDGAKKTPIGEAREIKNTRNLRNRRTRAGSEPFGGDAKCLAKGLLKKRGRKGVVWERNLVNGFKGGKGFEKKNERQARRHR